MRAAHGQMIEGGAIDFGRSLDSHLRFSVTPTQVDFVKFCLI